MDQARHVTLPGVVVRDVAELGTVLSVWAHPDDEAYLCGGLMAAAVDAGSRVVCVTATRGELGVTDPVRWPPDRLAEIREAEMAECHARILGVTEHHWLGYPGRRLRSRSISTAGAAADRRAASSEIRPDTVLTFAADGQTGHPDHIAVHHWTAEAVRRTGIGTLHVVANTAGLPGRHIWPGSSPSGAIVGDPPAPWTGPLSVDLALRRRSAGPQARGAGGPGQPDRGVPGRWSARTGTGRSSASSGLASWRAVSRRYVTDE